jgi:hypothetical protein
MISEKMQQNVKNILGCFPLEQEWQRSGIFLNMLNLLPSYIASDYDEGTRRD